MVTVTNTDRLEPILGALYYTRCFDVCTGCKGEFYAGISDYTSFCQGCAGFCILGHSGALSGLGVQRTVPSQRQKLYGNVLSGLDPGADGFCGVQRSGM